MTIELIANHDGIKLREMIESRGWTVDDDGAEAYYVARGWRSHPATYQRVKALMDNKAKIYWEPVPPPDLNAPDFAALSGVKWQDVTRPHEALKGRKSYQIGMPLYEGYTLAGLARECGHKVNVALSQWSPTVVVLTIYANRKRTYRAKLWASNATQARNALEELSHKEMEDIGYADNCQ